MRVYFEKPRTTVGWKGLINDPKLDGSFAINEGLRLARRFLADVAELGLPAGTEFLDPITPQFLADLVSWGAIGARTTESQVHRELASGLSMPVGFKNGTDGGVAGRHRRDPQRLPSPPFPLRDQAGAGRHRGDPRQPRLPPHPARGHRADRTTGRGRRRRRRARCSAPGLAPRLMVDCSHANSGKDHDAPGRGGRGARGPGRREGQTAIVGVMMESFLVEGRQDHEGQQALAYGQSITDACMGWERTAPLLDTLAAAVRSRRKRLAATA